MLSLKLSLIPLTLLAAFGAQATTLSDNLNATTYYTELVDGPNLYTAGFRTDSSSYTLNSVTALMQQDAPGTLSLSLYSSVTMSPANNLGYQPGVLLGTLTSPGTYPSSLGPVTFSGNNLSLSPNTNYWIVMGAPAGGTYEWAYAAGNDGSGVGFTPSWGYSTDSGVSWYTDDLQPMQMSVMGTAASVTPEPSAAWLLLVGVAVVFWRQHQSRKSGLLRDLR